VLIEIWSDVVCPWCYIGKRKFDEAVARVRPEFEDERIEVVYRSYQLDPTAPLGTTTPVIEAYSRKFGGPERASQIIEHVTSAAAEAGIGFRMDRALRANTLLAHRMLWIVLRDHGPSAQATVKESLMAAYFTEGRDISDVDTVLDVTTTALVDDPHERVVERERLENVLAGDDGVGEVSEQFATAAAHGISAVPTYVIDGQWAVPGAQDVDTFERVLRRVLNRDLR